MRLVLGVCGVLACMGCSKSNAGRGDLTLSNPRIDGKPEGVRAHLELALLKTPPGDIDVLFVQIGASLFVNTVRTAEWPELAELDDNPATAADTHPSPGTRMAVDVPVELMPEVKTHHSPNYDVVFNVFWGRDAEGPVHQARALSSLEAFYKRAY